MKLKKKIEDTKFLLKIFIPYYLLAIIISSIISFLIKYFNLTKFVPKINDEGAIFIFIISFISWLGFLLHYSNLKITKETNELIKKINKVEKNN